MSSDNKKKLWGGRFQDSASEMAEKLSASVHFDSRLYHYDIMGSKAHARMLQKSGHLSEEDCRAIIDGLTKIEEEIESGRFVFSPEREDVHMNIEARLTEMIGEPGKRLHTARSRNDQIALDMKLYLRDEYSKIGKLIDELIGHLVDMAERNIDVIMPGYTHLQVAQPVRFSHHMLAHCWALVRDRCRLKFFMESADILPLGVGALAGVNYANDREFLREELSFGSVTRNSMDTVADRDFAVEFLFFAALLGVHLSRFCEELILWSTAEFDFIRLSDRVTTGSSIMPQKRNPDIAELIRGKSGRLAGNLVSLLTVLKGLPLAYNRDMQEDKEPLFDSIDTVTLALGGMIEMVSTMEIRPGSMRRALYRNFSTATDIADYLVQKGMPFREAHEVTGSIVRHCESKGKNFFELTAAELRALNPSFDGNSVDMLDPLKSAERKVSSGGTSRESVLGQIAELKSMLREGER